MDTSVNKIDNQEYLNENYKLAIANCIELDTWPSFQGSQYSNDQRLEALAMVSIYGNVNKVAKIICIPQKTLWEWTKQTWWIDAVSKIQTLNKQYYNARINNIMVSALDNIDKRLKHGDQVIDKEGNTHNRAITGKDNAMIFGIMFDKRQVLNNMPTHITGKTAELTDLQQQFEQFTKAKEIKAEVTK